MRTPKLLLRPAISAGFRVATACLAATFFAVHPVNAHEDAGLLDEESLSVIPASIQVGGRALSGSWLPPHELEVAGQAFVTMPGEVLFHAGNARDKRPVGRLDKPVSADELVFLQTFLPGQGIADYRLAEAQAHRNIDLPPPPPILFTYEIHYVDGRVVDFPVRWGEAIEDAYRVQGVAPMIWARNAYIADIDGPAREHFAVYATTWPNPRPEVAIASIHLRPQPQGWVNYGDLMLFSVAASQKEYPGRLYFVDPSPAGDDAASGSFDEPLATIQEGLDRLQAGDTLFLRGGYYALNRMAMLTGPGGAEGKWITVSAYPGETPVIDGRGVNYDARLAQFNKESNWGPPYQRDQGILAVHETAGGHIRIQGLQVQNSLRSGISAHGVFLWTDRNIKPRPSYLDISFNTTYNIREIGVNIKVWNEVTAYGNRIVRSHSERMVFNVRGDQRHDIELPHDAPMNMRHHGQEALDLTYNDGFELAYNIVYGGGKEAIDCISVQNGIIRDNLVHSALNGIYIDSWGEPIVNLKIYRNYIYNAFAGIPCATEGSNNLINFDIFENIVINAHANGINITEATYKAQPAKVYNHRIFRNTVHRAGHHNDSIDWLASGIGIGGFAHNPDVRDMKIFENIVTDTAHAPLKSNLRDLDQRNISFERNLVWPDQNRTPERLLNDRPGRIWDYVRGEGLIGENPRYVDAERGDFRLQEGSPAIGAAADGGDLGALPFGVAWRQGFDFAGRVTSYYFGDIKWEPVHLPRDKFNTFYNHLQRPRFFQETRYGEDLQLLPSGIQAHGGVIWSILPDQNTDVPNVITLSGRQSEAADTNVNGLTIGRAATRLAFLHTAYVTGGDQDGLTLAKYRVWYEDGSFVDVPVTVGRNIRTWSQNFPADLPEARVAWTIPTILRRDQIAWSVLYGFVWTNPEPAKIIKQVDFMRVGDPLAGTVALFSISTAQN